MAQSTIELPDPLEGSAGYAGADDLLAQLAGEEVDRLLSDAETSELPAGELAMDAGADEQDEALQTRERVAEVAGDELTPNALDELFTQINGETPEVGLERRDGEAEESFHDRREISADAAAELSGADSVAETGDEAGGAIDPDWEAFQNEIKTSAVDENEGAPASREAEPASVADALAAEMEEDERINRVGNARGMETAENEMGEAETAALTEAGATDEAPAVVIDEAFGEPLEAEVAEMEAEAEAGPMPILVRVLEWINAPLSGFSEGVREALGKVAIVTMLNATAVLVYVLMFRKHP